MADKYVLEPLITISFARQIKIFVATPRIYARVCSRREIYARVCSRRGTSARAVVATLRIYAGVCSRRGTSVRDVVATPIGVLLR